MAIDLDLRDVVDSFATGTFTVTRTTALTYDSNGRATAPTTTTCTIDACVQDVDGVLLQRLPEGFRTTDTMSIYTTTPLQVDAMPDRIQLVEGLYEVTIEIAWGVLAGIYVYVVTRVPA